MTKIFNRKRGFRLQLLGTIEISLLIIEINYWEILKFFLIFDLEKICILQFLEILNV